MDRAARHHSRALRGLSVVGLGALGRLGAVGLLGAVALLGVASLIGGQAAAGQTTPATARPAMAPPAECKAPAMPLPVDLQASVIRWKGTKFWGLGSHEGIVRLKSGAVCLSGGEVTGGFLVADMNTIEVTDIPASDPVPRQRLRDHLMSEDFFHAAAHPEARMVLTSVKKERQGLYQVSAALTIRGKTHPVAFFVRAMTVSEREVRAETRFEVDRQLFGVSYRGSVKDDLVDDEIDLSVKLEARAGR